MPRANSFRINIDLILNYDDKFWDDCIDNFRIMYWAMDNIAIQVNPKPREKEEE